MSSPQSQAGRPSRTGPLPLRQIVSPSVSAAAKIRLVDLGHLGILSLEEAVAWVKVLMGIDVDPPQIAGDGATRRSQGFPLGTSDSVRVGVPLTVVPPHWRTVARSARHDDAVACGEQDKDAIVASSQEARRAHTRRSCDAQAALQRFAVGAIAADIELCVTHDFDNYTRAVSLLEEVLCTRRGLCQADEDPISSIADGQGHHRQGRPPSGHPCPWRQPLWCPAVPPW